MKKNKVREKFLEEISELPVISAVCNRLNLSRQTIYRWRKEDSKFRAEMDEAMDFGDDFISDLCDTQLLKMIQSQNWPAIKYYLDKRSKRYQKRSSDNNMPLSHQVIPPERMKKIKEMQARWMKPRNKPKKELPEKDTKLPKKKIKVVRKKEVKREPPKNPPLIFA